MSLFIRVFKCECGKAHLCTGVTPASVCLCGRNLWAIMWDVAH